MATCQGWGGEAGRGAGHFLHCLLKEKETKQVNQFSFELVVCCSGQLLLPLRSSVAARELVGLAVNKRYFTPSAWILWCGGLPDKRISSQQLLGAAPAWQSHLSHRHCSCPWS